MSASRRVAGDLRADTGIAAVELHWHDDRTVRQAIDRHDLGGTGREIDDRGDERFWIRDNKLCWSIGRWVGDDEIHHAVAIHTGDCGGTGGRCGVGNSTEADEAAGGDTTRHYEM